MYLSSPKIQQCINNCNTFDTFILAVDGIAIFRLSVVYFSHTPLNENIFSTKFLPLLLLMLGLSLLLLLFLVVILLLK